MDKIIEQKKSKFNEFLKTKVSRESTVKQYLNAGSTQNDTNE